jgi:hypothetical protein
VRAMSGYLKRLCSGERSSFFMQNYGDVYALRPADGFEIAFLTPRGSAISFLFCAGVLLACQLPRSLWLGN